MSQYNSPVLPKYESLTFLCIFNTTTKYSIFNLTSFM